ncbi:hypothetical protein R3P38DRAFT_2889944 [Favolaschia claudopus]|uniref:Uncharacterized protein n=1 Tax=Favolaschia claudopus TaxID=2862362 RepID=A0AAW0CTA2_9AGAR
MSSLPAATTTPLQIVITDAALAYITSTATADSTSQPFSFSFRNVSSTSIWSTIQDAPDAMCAQLALAGEHVLRTCFLSLALSSDFGGAGTCSRPSGFIATIRDAILIPAIYSALINCSNSNESDYDKKLHWRGPATRPASDAFLLFVAALHVSTDDYDRVLAWFKETFGPLINVAVSAYDESSSSVQQEGNCMPYQPPDYIYAPALELLAQIKAQTQTGDNHFSTSKNIGTPPKSASGYLLNSLQTLQKATRALAFFSAVSAPTTSTRTRSSLTTAAETVAKLAQNTLRITQWKKTGQSKRRPVKSILDIRPHPSSYRNFDNTDSQEEEVPDTNRTQFQAPQQSFSLESDSNLRIPAPFPCRLEHLAMANPSESVTRPWQYTRSVSAFAPSLSNHFMPRSRNINDTDKSFLPQTSRRHSQPPAGILRLPAMRRSSLSFGRASED